MNASELNRKNVSVHLDTYDRLAEYGSVNDSFTEVIRIVLDYAESKGMTRDTLAAFRKSQRAKR